MNADEIVRFIWNDEATRPSREAFAKIYDYMQANPDPLPEGVVRARMETGATPIARFECAYCQRKYATAEVRNDHQDNCDPRNALNRRQEHE